jgi:exonuclease III
MAFRNKKEILNQFNPDIVVLQECESEEVLNNKKSKIDYESHIWFGKNKNKGIGVMSFNGFKLELLDHNTEFQYILPIKVFNDKQEFFMLAIWTQLINKEIYISYVVQATRAFKYYQELLKKDNIIIVGDFNSSAVWDNESPKEYNHSEMVSILNEQNIVSVYHLLNHEKHGEEKTPTLYFTRNINKTYHIDYIFMKEKMTKNIKSFFIGKHEEYIGLSDHMPLFMELY